MTFDPTIGLGSILVMITLFAGGVGAFYSLKGDAKEAGTRVGSLEAQHAKVSKQLSDLELQVARDAKDYVNRNDLKDGLKEVEARLGKRMDDIEHTVRNSATKMAGELREMIRDLVPRRAERDRGERP